VERAVRQWLKSVVVDLNLCPFAAPVLRASKLRIVVSHAKDLEHLVQDVSYEAMYLARSSEDETATSILAVSEMLSDFGEYNQFLDVTDSVVVELGLEGVLQIASFHPHYQFAGTEPDDLENYSNRSPYPLLHFLRESQVTQAVDGPIDTSTIPAQNKAALAALGLEEMQLRLRRCMDADE
jgi:uncharacterized protein